MKKNLEFEPLWELVKENPEEEGSLWGDGIIPVRGMVVLHTGSKRGKSMLTHNVALAGAAGWSEFLDLPLRSPFRTAIFQREVSRAGMNQRTGRMVQEAPAPLLDALKDVFHNKSRALRLSDPVVFNELQAYLRELKAHLVILDPFAHICTENENDNAEVGKVLERIAVLRDDPGCAVWIVHHDRKTSEATRGAPPSQNARGADRLIADADSVISLVPAGKHPSGPASRFHVISRYGPSLEPFAAVFNQRTFWWERIAERGEISVLATWCREQGGGLPEAVMFKLINEHWNLKDNQHRAAKRYLKKAVDTGVLKTVKVGGVMCYDVPNGKGEK